MLDHVRDLGWPGVMGNTDEMLVHPEALEAFAAQSQAPTAMWDKIREIATATRAALGKERLAWLRGLPMDLFVDDLALVHAQPGDCWRAPAPDASDADLAALYGPLQQRIVIFGHTHLPSIRRLSGRAPQLVINTGSVGLPYDGDPRASYLVLDNGAPTIRRVDYALDHELALLSHCGLPGAAWTAKMLRARAPTLP